MLASILDVTVMTLEILAAEFVFALALERRKQFWVRFLGSAFMCLEIVWIIIFMYCKITDSFFVYDSTTAPGESVFKFFFFVAVFAMSIACIAFSFDRSIWVILFYCSGGYAAQHIAKNVTNILKTLPEVSFYCAEYSFWFPYLLEALVCAIVYLSVYFLLVRNKVLYCSKRGMKTRVFVSLFVLIICVGISRLSADNPERNFVAVIAESLYAIVGCSLVLFILFIIDRSEKTENEVETMTELLRREREQYKLSKENIELINMKCHDLKHQLSALKGNYSEDKMKEIESAVMIYDATVKTGNDVLDVILTEKSLYCEKNGIKLTCLVDAGGLSFMDNMDIYSLFGNALSNAIESAGKVTSSTRRVVTVNAQTFGNFFSVHIENYYDGEIVFDKGLPMTDGDKNYHGFGMKSMGYIAKSYDGQMSVTAKDGKFSLDFVFPLKKSQ